jgi:hypothetical protein
MIYGLILKVKLKFVARVKILAREKENREIFQ